MAKIAGLQEQKEALKTINGLLEEVKKINEFFHLENPSGQYEISFTTTETVEKDGAEKKKKKTHTAPFLCSDREVINRYVRACKEEKSKTIKELAEKHHIVLDEAETALLQ